MQEELNKSAQICPTQSVEIMNKFHQCSFTQTSCDLPAGSSVSTTTTEKHVDVPVDKNDRRPPILRRAGMCRGAGVGRRNSIEVVCL